MDAFGQGAFAQRQPVATLGQGIGADIVMAGVHQGLQLLQALFQLLWGAGEEEHRILQRGGQAFEQAMDAAQAISRIERDATAPVGGSSASA